jgi:hypothetical protein
LPHNPHGDALYRLEAASSQKKFFFGEAGARRLVHSF